MSRGALLRQQLRVLRGGAEVGDVCFEAGPPALPSLPGPLAIPDGTAPTPEEWPMLFATLQAWASRNAMSRADFDKLSDRLKARTVTAKRLLETSAIADLRQSIQDAILEGKTIKAWRREAWDELADRYGSAGASAPWYMVTVFRTNIQAAYAAGRYGAMFGPEDLERAPLVLYDAIDDERVRPEHHALDGKVFRKDDPAARRYFPPLGFNCRCQLVELTEDEAYGLGLSVTDGKAIEFLPIPNDRKGRAIGRPPDGWDTDRVESLVNPDEWGWIKGPDLPAPDAPLPLEAPAAAPLAKKGGKKKKVAPDGYAPNGLHPDDVLAVWPTAKAQLLPDGGVKFPKSGKQITAAKARQYAEKAYLGDPGLKPATNIFGSPIDPKWKAPPKVPKIAPNGLTNADVKAVFADGAKLKKNGSVVIPDAGGLKGNVYGPKEARELVLDAYSANPKIKPPKSVLGTDLDPLSPHHPMKAALAGKPGPTTPLGYTQADIDEAMAGWGVPADHKWTLLEDGSLDIKAPSGSTVLSPYQADGLIASSKKTLAEKVALAEEAAAAAAKGIEAKTLEKLAAGGLSEEELAVLFAPEGPASKMFPASGISGYKILPNGQIATLGGESLEFYPGEVLELLKDVKNANIWTAPGMKTAGGVSQAELDALIARSPELNLSGLKVHPDGSLSVTVPGGVEVAVPLESADEQIALWKAKAAKLKAALKAPPAPPAKTLYDVPALEEKPGFVDSSNPFDFSPSWNLQPGETPTSRMSFGAVVFDDQGRLLLREPKNHYDGYSWTFAKGTRSAVTDGVLDTAKREVLEETGVAFTAVDVIPGSFKGGSSRVRLFMGRKISDGAGWDAETESLRWVDFTEARRLVATSTNAVGRQRDLEILAAAEKQYEAITGVPALKLPKKIRPPAPPPPPLQTVRKSRPATKPRPPLVDALTDFPADPTKLRVVRGLGGSTGAELVEDAKGNRFVRKRGASAEHLHEECTADALYRQLGVNVPAFRLYETSTGPVKLSRYLDGAETLATIRKTNPSRYAEAARLLREDFAADALLGNWDVVGLTGDNVLVDAAGVPWRIDNGGSLRFRAQGGRKDPKEWTGNPTELWSLRKKEWSVKSLGEPTADVFGPMNASDLLESLERVLANSSGLTDGLPVDLARVLGDRLDSAGVVSRALGDLLADGFADRYADDFARHLVGLRAAGVTDLLPTTLRPKKGPGAGRGQTEMVDSSGRLWGGLRESDSAPMRALDAYFSANGGSWDDFSGWAGSQAGSSGAQHSLAVKMLWTTKIRPTPFDALYWHSNPQKEVERMFRSYFSGAKLASAEATFTIQHAFTYNLLLRSGLPTVNAATRTIRAIRQESASLASRWGLSRAGAMIDDPKRGALESYSFLREAFSESGYVTTEQELPLHWVLGTFLQPRSSSGGAGAFYGDGENEFVASFFWGKVRRIAYGSFKW